MDRDSSDQCIALPELPKLEGKHNLEYWKRMLQLKLEHHGLEHYLRFIISEHRRNEANERIKQNNAAISYLIQSSISPVLMNLLQQETGWDPESRHPAMLYNSICMVMEDLKDPAPLAEELTRMSLMDYYPYTSAFIYRLGYLARHIKRLYDRITEEQLRSLVKGAMRCHGICSPDARRQVLGFVAFVDRQDKNVSSFDDMMKSLEDYDWK